MNAALRNVLCLTLPGVLLIALTACGGSDGGQSAVPASTTQSASTQSASESGDAWLGHYVGSATIAGVQYFADAMTTADGLIRLYVAGPIDADYGGIGGNLPQTVPATSAQLVGTLQGPTNQISGDGLVFGQQCEASDPNQFCADIGHANISVAYSNDTDSLPAIQGNILVTTSAGTETWSLNMSLYGPNYIGMSTAKDSRGSIRKSSQISRLAATPSSQSATKGLYPSRARVRAVRGSAKSDRIWTGRKICSMSP